MKHTSPPPSAFQSLDVCYLLSPRFWESPSILVTQVGGSEIPTHILDILSPFHKEVSLHQESDHGSCWYQEDIFRWWFIKYMFLFPLKM